MNSKTVLISGGTSGIGKATVVRLLEDGYNVATFSNNQEKCDALKSELSGQYENDRLLVLCADVTNEEQVKDVVAKTVEHFGTIDILINNAGIGFDGPIESIDIAKFQNVLAVNVIGIANTSKYVVPVMKERKSGLIINVVSKAGKEAKKSFSAYNASKFAAHGFSEAMRLELIDQGIRVAQVHPGRVDTELWYDLHPDKRGVSEEDLPVRMTPKDIANAISFVCSQPEHITIEDLTIAPLEPK